MYGGVPPVAKTVMVTEPSQSIKAGSNAAEKTGAAITTKATSVVQPLFAVTVTTCIPGVHTVTGKMTKPEVIGISWIVTHGLAQFKTGIFGGMPTCGIWALLITIVVSEFVQPPGAVTTST